LLISPLEQLLKKTKDEKDQDTLLSIHRNAKQLQKFINELFELSKLKDDKADHKIENLDIISHTNYIVESLKKEAQKKRIELSLFSAHKALVSQLDRRKINLIYSVLLNNALRHTPSKGHITVAISGCTGNNHSKCTMKKGCLVISIKNTGKGIPQDKIPYLFNKFPQLKQNKAPIGLEHNSRLSLVKLLVLDHKGTIDVVSKENEYTKFIIHLPFGHYGIQADKFFTSCINHKMPNSEIASKMLTVSSKNDLKVGDDEKVILVIDDHEDMRTIVRLGLNKEYTIIEAKDGEEGIASAIQTIPNLILCDVRMENTNGFEVCKTLKSNELTSHIPIILITANDSLTDKIEGLNSGADDYLPKPFYVSELKSRIKNLIKLRISLIERFDKSAIFNLKKSDTKSFDEIFLEKVVTTIENNLSNENLSVSTLMDELSISRTPLHRKLKSLTNLSANEVIQNIRLQRAAEMLENKTASIAEIGFLVGYSTPPNFTRAFKSHFGHTPSKHPSKVQ